MKRVPVSVGGIVIHMPIKPLSHGLIIQRGPPLMGRIMRSDMTHITSQDKVYYFSCAVVGLHYTYLALVLSIGIQSFSIIHWLGSALRNSYELK